MAIEEQVSSRIASVGQQAAADAARLTVRVSGRLAEQLAGAGGWTLIKGAGALKDRIDSGHMSEARLQKVTGGDIHELRLDRESLHAVSRSLKHAGLDYAIEHDGDDHYLHFRGRDLDHVQHAVSRAFRSIGLDLDPDTITAERTTPDQAAPDRQPREQTDNPSPERDQPEPSGPAETATSISGGDDPLEPDEPDQTRTVSTPGRAGTTRRQTRGTATRHAAGARSRTDAGNARTGKETPGRAGRKGRDDFLAMLNKQTERKLSENRNAPKRVIEHRRGRP